VERRRVGQRAEFELANLRNIIGAELRNILHNVASQIAQIEVAEKNLSLAEEELRLARVRYEQGVADNRELIDAENRFTLASFNLVALFNYHAARVELARVRGDVRLILAEKVP
jgi:outer membrane protein TolC